MAEPIFSDYRRDLVARTFFDLLKISVAAAFASKFFFEFGWPVKIGMWSVIITFGVLGFFFCPRNPPRKEGA
jgi:hypothetical protein